MHLETSTGRICFSKRWTAETLGVGGAACSEAVVPSAKSVQEMIVRFRCMIVNGKREWLIKEHEKDSDSLLLGHAPGGALFFHELSMVFSRQGLHVFDHFRIGIGDVICLRDILAQVVEFVTFAAERKLP